MIQFKIDPSNYFVIRLKIGEIEEWGYSAVCSTGLDNRLWKIQDINSPEGEEIEEIIRWHFKEAGDLAIEAYKKKMK